MKKFLSMVLALVMVMSLVTVSAGAKDFTDNENITYDEAVAVVSEVGIVDGYTDGKFNPTNTLTRQAAAKIICNLILGPTTAAELHADTAPYRDVPVNSEFAGYIAYCQAKGIISGYADGAFRPGNTLTGYAFMKMLLGALGYDATLENYVGANWSINVAKQALGIGLNKGLVDEFNGIKAVTREEACLYAFNTLQSDIVEYGQRLTTNVNGTEVVLSSGGAKSREWNSQQTRYDNIRRDDIVQFAEEYFNKLVRRDDYTKFMEPANVWIYDKVEIGTFERRDLIVEQYTTGVSGKTIYDLFKAGVISDNDLEVYIDGVDGFGSGNVTITGNGTYSKFDKGDLVRSNNNDLGATDDGVWTKVYLDTDKELISIVSRHTWLAKATADYSESREYAPLSMYYAANNTTHTYNVDKEEVPNVVDVTKDTFYQINVSWRDSTTGEVVVIKDVEILEDSAVTKFSASDSGSGNGRVTKLTTGGTEYKANVKAFYDKDVLDEYNQTLLTDCTYNVILDSNNYFIGVELYEGVKNYVFVTGFDRNTSNLAVKTATACGIFLDGTMENFEVNVTDTDKNIVKAQTVLENGNYFQKWADTSWQAGRGANGVYNLNQWYTYTKNDSGVYTLKPCARMTATRYALGTPASIRTDALNVNDDLTPGNRVYGEDATIFLTVELNVVDTTNSQLKAITEVTGVYTGVQSVDIDIDVADPLAVQERQVFTVYDSDYYVIGAVVIGEARGATANYAYVTSGPKSEEKIGDTYYWEFDAVLGGVHQTLTAKSKYHNTIEALVKDSVQELRFDGDYVVSIKNISNTKIYTDSTAQIADAHEVYEMRDELTGGGYTVDDPDTLVLQGRTLYITAARTDVGLALASDCKAVTIQVENGSTKKTNFDDVSSAIAHLADAQPTINGFQYDGKIYAVLNSNKTAAWVVFVNDTELKTGAQTGGDELDIDGLGIAVDRNSLQVLAKFKFGTPAAVKRQQIALALRDAGVNVSMLDSGLTYATDSNGDYYIITVEEYYEISVDGKVVERVKNTGGTDKNKTLIKIPHGANDGTHYKQDIAGTVTYASNADIAINGLTLTNNVAIESRYVAAPSVADGAGVSSVAVTNLDGTPLASHVKVGSSVLVSVPVTAVPGATAGAKVEVTLANAGTATVPAVKTLTIDEYKAGKTVTFTVSNITGATGNITGAATAIPAVMSLVDPAVVLTKANGLTVTALAETSVASVGDIVRVTVTISGTATAATGLTLTCDNGGTAPVWSSSEIPASGATRAASKLTIENGASYTSPVTAVFTYTVSATANQNAPIITVNDD